MPLWDFSCENEQCKYQCELLIWFNEPIPTECPKCNQKTLTKLFGVPINPELKTIGSIADKNAAEFSSEHKQEIIDKYHSKKNQKRVLDTPKGWKIRYGNRN